MTITSDLSITRRQLLAFVSVTSACAVLPLHAQEVWPSRTIRWIVPYSAGGGTDNLARVLADAMRAELGQTLVIENRPGASTNLGAGMVARAKPDGYTIMSADNALMAFNEHLFTSLPFNPETDFSYVGGIGRFPLALVVTPDFPALDFPQFLAYVKANPDKVNYASAGNGSPHHLAMEMFKLRTQTRMTHIAYRGGAPAMQAVMGGQADVMFLDLVSGLGVMRSGRARAIAIGTAQRTVAIPEVPTLAEFAVPDAQVYTFQALLGPAGLPERIVMRLNQALNKALQNRDLLNTFLEYGMEPLTGSPEALRQYARAEAQRWGQVIRTNRIRAGG